MRRKILLIGGVVIIVLGAALYCLGLYWNADSIPGDPNIGAGVTMLFGEIIGVLGVGVLAAWAIVVMVVRLRRRDSSSR